MERLQSKGVGSRRKSAGGSAAGAGGGKDDEDGPKITCVAAYVWCCWGGSGGGWLGVVAHRAACSVCVRKRPLAKREKARKEIDVLKPVSRQTILVYEPKYVLPVAACAAAAAAAAATCR